MKACNGSSLYTTHVGKIKLNTLIINYNGNNKECSLTIKDVYYCYKMNTNLISLGTLISNGLFFGVFKKRLTVIDDDEDIIMEGALLDILFKLRFSEFNNFRARKVAKVMVAKNSLVQRASAQYWHEIITYLNYNNLVKLPAMVEGI